MTYEFGFSNFPKLSTSSLKNWRIGNVFFACYIKLIPLCCKLTMMPNVKFGCQSQNETSAFPSLVSNETERGVSDGGIEFYIL